MKIQAKDIAGFAEGIVEKEDALAAVPEKYHAHIDADALAFEIEVAGVADVITVVGRCGAVHVKGSSDLDLGLYHYRGLTFERRENGINGYWGAWAVGREWTDSLADCKRIIDARLDS